MKKILFIIASIATLLTVSCSKQETPFVENHDPAHRTFMVDVQRTKTTLDGLAVKWASTDEIRILGYTEGEEVGNAVFKLKSGAGSTSAVFEIKEGETLAEYDEYYAVYPAVAIKTSELNSMIKLNANLGTTPSPIENGFDPNYALMTASYDGSKLVFRHAMAYIKIKIAQEGITKFKMEWTGGSASCTKPGFKASDGDFVSSDGGYKSFSSTGTFNNGSYYYFPIVARGGNPGTITLTYYKGAAEASTSTTSLSSKPWVQGEVYDLGAPVVDFSPVISTTDITGVAYAGVSTTHPVSFVNAVGWTPSIQSYTGCVSAASLASTDEITADPSAGTINYTVGAYDALVGNTGTIVVRLTKAGEDPIDKTINVTQNSSSGPVVNTYLLYVNSSKQLTRTKNGEAFNDYFNTGTGTSILDCEEGTYFGTATSYTINGDTYRYARKLDGSNPLSFTVTTGATATLKFYAARREQTKTTTIKVKKDGSNVIAPELQWADGKAVLYESSVIDLVAGSTYTFEKSGDNIGIFYVEVVETID